MAKEKIQRDKPTSQIVSEMAPGILFIFDPYDDPERYVPVTRCDMEYLGEHSKDNDGCRVIRIEIPEHTKLNWKTREQEIEAIYVNVCANCETELRKRFKKAPKRTAKILRFIAYTCAIGYKIHHTKSDFLRGETRFASKNLDKIIELAAVAQKLCYKPDHDAT